MTWGTCKGVRGYWEWTKRGHVKFTPAEQVRKRAASIQVIKDIEPFQNVAVDRNQIIGGRRQKRDMMRAYNLVECGDLRQTPKESGPKYDAKSHQRAVVQDLKRALHQHGMGD